MEAYSGEVRDLRLLLLACHVEADGVSRHCPNTRTLMGVVEDVMSS